MSSGDKPRIVLIEDNDGDVYLIRRALAAHKIDCELMRFEDGEGALETIIAGPAPGTAPDLILLDLNLPRKDGRQVLSAARQNPKLADTAIAVITSSFSPRDREEALALGADTYIHKPSHLDDFIRAVGGTVQELLGKRRGG